MGWLSGAVVASTSLLLGIVFTNWTVDHYVLWQPAPVEPSQLHAALQYYRDVWTYPPYVSVAVSLVYSIATLSALLKVVFGGMLGMLFDGASFMLLVAIFGVYMRDLEPCLRQINSDSTLPHLSELKRVASGHLSICVCLTGILMLQASQHFVSRASSTDSMPEGASVAAVPADDVAAPVGASTATADDKPPAAPQVRPRKTRAANGLAKTESDAPAVPNGGGAQRVTRSKSAALKQEDSHVAPATTATATKSKAKR